MKKMTTKEVHGNPGTGTNSTERLWVGVRIRPIDISPVTPYPVITVLNSHTLIFTEPQFPATIDLEHHFRTGTIFQSTGTGVNNGNRISMSYRQPPHPPTSAAYNNNNNNVNPLRQHKYEFDHVFDETANQEEVYKFTAAPLVRSVLEGFYATIFAYGATGSGKTHTMVGTPTNPGIMARAVDDIFHICAKESETDKKTEVYLSYLEIYNEQIRDLLRSHPGPSLELREDKDQVHVAGLTEVRATSTNEVLNLLQKGNRLRTMESTSANLTSSRSHAILIVTVVQKSMSSNELIEGKLYLIDLAGSERASNTKNSGVRLREGGHINRSLLALGNCITALASGDSDKYINYRDSKLTRLLKVALGGASKTAMIAHVNPLPQQREESKNTLLYGQRARTISNRVKKFIHQTTGASTVDSSLQVIQELRTEVKRLQLKLDEKFNHPHSPPPEQQQQPRKQQTTSSTVATSTVPLHHEFLINHEKPNLEPIKAEIVKLFEEEFKLRNDLLKLDGAMLQSALDCEILRLMILDWENLRVGAGATGSGNGSGSDDILETVPDFDPEKSEINSVMIELKQVRQEQDKLLHLRNEVEDELKRVRGRIAQVEDEAMEYLPEIQRAILSLLCKLQQDQVNKMSIEIEAELKRRGSLLLRCLRQKALGEAIIHRQRHFLNAISGRMSNREGLLSSQSNGLQSPFFPPLLAKTTTTPIPSSTNDRLFHTPPQAGRNSRNKSTKNHRLPPLSRNYSDSPPLPLATTEENLPITTTTTSNSNTPPKTTKYSDYRKIRQKERTISYRSSSEEELQRLADHDHDHSPSRIRRSESRHTVTINPQSQSQQLKTRKHRSNSQDRILISY